jgi:hypothetical protein
MGIDMRIYKVLLVLILSMLLGHSVVVLAADFDKGVVSTPSSMMYELGAFSPPLSLT